MKKLQDNLFSLLSSDRPLLANECGGDLSWEWHQCDAYLGAPRNQMSKEEQQQQYLPPHQHLQLRLYKEPWIRTVLELHNDHQALERKRHAYV